MLCLQPCGLHKLSWGLSNRWRYCSGRTSHLPVPLVSRCCWKPCRHSLWSYHAALSIVGYPVLRSVSAYQCQLQHAETNISSCRNTMPGYTASSPSTTRAQLSSDEWKQALKNPDCKLKPISIDFLPFSCALSSKCACPGLFAPAGGTAQGRQQQASTKWTIV